MRQILLLFTFVVITFYAFGQDELVKRIKALPHVASINKIDVDPNFTAQYEIYFNQPIDHTKPEKERFLQRVVLSHNSTERPVVCVLEGYKIWSAKCNELSKLLNANQINIEHRFFKDSKPDSVPWDKLTIWQAATDHHLIIQALQSIYQQNWLTTGISKGGQVTMFHKVFYPFDVQMGISYVAPLNFAREDERIYSFLNSVGTKEERSQIYNFQKACFEKQDSLMVLLKDKAVKNNWEFKFGYKKAVQYTILEYPFAFYQWGGVTFSSIPETSANAQVLFEHLHNVADFNFFEEHKMEEMRSFYWAALTEIGMYGYETQPFKEYLGDTTNFTFDFSAPQGIETSYNDSLMLYVKKQLDNYGNNMLYVVGGLDTWGATAYSPEGKSNAVRMTLQEGHHGTRIRHFNKEDKEKIYRIIEEWMEIEGLSAR